MLIRRAVIDSLGLLDEIYHIGYFDDTDYCKKAQGYGFMTARSKGAYVWHMENISFKMLKENKELFRKNEEVFFRRWGRPVRVGYFIDRISSVREIDDIAISVARKGHPIFIFLKRGLKWPVSLDHFDIRRFDLNGVFFGFVSIYKIFKRKKKKQLEVILTDNRLFGNFLRSIGFLHGSDVIIRPRRDEVLDILKERSRHF
jgi:GT2 family glycosyltransferase